QHRRVVALLAQCPAHGKAVDAGQHHSEHDERAVLPAEPLERPLGIPRGAHLIAFGAQILHDAGREVRIVLHYQHARCGRRRAHERCPWAAAGQVSPKRAPCPTPSLWALTRPCGVTAERAFSRMLRTTTSSASGSLTTLSPGSMSQEIAMRSWRARSSRCAMTRVTAAPRSSGSDLKSTRPRSRRALSRI